MSLKPAGRLLLVEDETVLRSLVSQFLTLEDFEVVPAADGQAAVDAYASHGPFDLVLLDLNLPVLPGVEACRRIKEVDADQPFLVCSAAILDSHVEALEALGVTESLGKPYHPVELLTRIHTILGRPRTAAADDGAERPWRNHRRQPASPAARALSKAPVFD
jgi:DNA-binding response OmpR family regulator